MNLKNMPVELTDMVLALTVWMLLILENKAMQMCILYDLWFLECSLNFPKSVNVSPLVLHLHADSLRWNFWKWYSADVPDLYNLGKNASMFHCDVLWYFFWHFFCIWKICRDWEYLIVIKFYSIYLPKMWHVREISHQLQMRLQESHFSPLMDMGTQYLLKLTNTDDMCNQKSTLNLVLFCQIDHNNCLPCVCNKLLRQYQRTRLRTIQP